MLVLAREREREQGQEQEVLFEQLVETAQECELELVTSQVLDRGRWDGEEDGFFPLSSS